MNKSTGTKIFLFLSVLSGSLWMGSYLSRIILSYQFFEGTDFNLKPIFNSQTLNGAIVNLNSLIVLSVILYFVFIISFLLFLGLSKIRLKQNGWLFIITIIVFLTFPFEIYLMTIDFKIISQVLSAQFNGAEIINLLIDRFKVLGSFPLIELFCYASIIYFMIFQPLTLKDNEN